MCVAGASGQDLELLDDEALDCVLHVGSDVSAGTKSWWVHLVRSGIERICRPRADDLLHGPHGAAGGAAGGQQRSCSGSTWYTPGGLISQAAYARHTHAHDVCMACAWRVHGMCARWLARRPRRRRHDAARPSTRRHRLTHSHTHARAPQVVTLTLLDIVFLVLNELLWGLLWTVLSRLPNPSPHPHAHPHPHPHQSHHPNPKASP